MNSFRNTLKKYDIKDDVLKRRQLTTVQVNMGDLCNQRCGHCHVAASPEGKKNMTREVVDQVLGFLSRNKIRTLDITGGAPELNPNFEYFVEKARPLVDELIVRSNLTVIFEKGRQHLPEFYKTNKVHLICSLPCYTEENVEKQRGRGVFHSSRGLLWKQKMLHAHALKRLMPRRWLRNITARSCRAAKISRPAPAVPGNRFLRNTKRSLRRSSRRSWRSSTGAGRPFHQRWKAARCWT